MQCPKCQSQQTVKNGKKHLQDQSDVQKYWCKACGRQFNQRTGTPMARLRTPLRCGISDERADGRIGRTGNGTLVRQIALDDSALGGTVGEPEPAVGTSCRNPI